MRPALGPALVPPQPPHCPSPAPPLPVLPQPRGPCRHSRKEACGQVPLPSKSACGFCKKPVSFSCSLRVLERGKSCGCHTPDCKDILRGIWEVRLNRTRNTVKALCAPQPCSSVPVEEAPKRLSSLPARFSLKSPAPRRPQETPRPSWAPPRPSLHLQTQLTRLPQGPLPP